MILLKYVNVQSINNVFFFLRLDGLVVDETRLVTVTLKKKKTILKYIIFYVTKIPAPLLQYHSL